MKTMKYISGKYVILFMVLSLFCVKSRAQSVADNLHFNIDWQMNAPVSTDFGDKISGWGMNFEGGYYVAPHWSVGAFVNYHTNHKYVGRQTLPVSSTASLTTDQQQSVFRLPFGLSAAYKIGNGSYVRPYFGIKAGAMYAKSSSYLNTVQVYDKSWGFYASPELGMNIYPVPDKRFGFHVALYYSYATNQSELLTYSQDGMNNLGFRLGICF